MQTSVRVFALVLLASFSSALGQPRFVVPLTVTDGVATGTLYLGIRTAANFCIVGADTLNGHAEEFLPPTPPSGIFDTRFVWPRNGSNAACFDQGSLSDFRPYTSLAQRDSFRIKSQLGDGATMVISWPAGLASHFSGLNLRFIGGSGAVNTDMLTNTSVDITDAGDPATCNIYSAGLVTSVEQTSPYVPREFGLNQNYPNPFNPTTKIEFSVAQAAKTDISVYDILGRKVATLASELLAPGYYNVQWAGTNSTGANVASGVYFVRMTSESEQGAKFSAIRKLMLMK